MSCSKYTLTNTGSTSINFSYQRCNDALWQYQVELFAGQTKNIWLIDGTFTIPLLYSTSVELTDDGVFPPVDLTPTPTPATQTPTPSYTSTPTQTPTSTSTQTPTSSSTQTPTYTPTQTPTSSQTPTFTPTQTSTPTPTAVNVFTVYSGATADEACGQYYSTISVYGNNSQFDLSSQFSNISSFPPSINMTGFIKNGGFVAELDSVGMVVGSISVCSTLTPTPTNTGTPTQTPTNTPSPTPTFGYYTYSLGSGATANDACIDFSSSPMSVYGTVSGGAGPNLGEFLYLTPGNPPTDPAGNGYFSNGTAVFTVSGGNGEITAVDPSGC